LVEAPKTPFAISHSHNQEKERATLRRGKKGHPARDACLVKGEWVRRRDQASNSKGYCPAYGRKRFLGTGIRMTVASWDGSLRCCEEKGGEVQMEPRGAEGRTILSSCKVAGS